MTLPLSNTVDGRILAPAKSEDLALGYLAKLNSDGEAELAGVTSHPVAARFVVVDSDDNNAALMPLSPTRQVRVVLSGTCTCGDQLAGTAAGKAILLASAATGACPILVAEEDGVDGQLVLCRGLAAYVEPDELPAIAGGDAGKVLTVKEDESGVEWAAAPTELPAIAGGDAGKVLAVKGDETGVEFQTKNGLSAAMGSVKDVYATRQNGAITEATWLNLLSALNLIGADLPTSDPYETGKWWNDGGTVKISGGI